MNGQPGLYDRKRKIKVNNKKNKNKGGKQWQQLIWDAEMVSRFHDFAVNWPALQNNYFTRRVGEGILNCLHHCVNLEGRILDYGCGPGYLIELLLNKKIPCEAVDFSPDTINLLNSRFHNNPFWGGARLFSGNRLSFDKNTFDTILCIETLEHVLPEHMDLCLGELHRILKPCSGRLFLTTPNNEDLSVKQVCCPNCSNIFHRVQHVNTFTNETLSHLLEKHGFKTILCSATSFHRFENRKKKNIIDWTLRDSMKAIRDIKDSVFDRIFPQSISNFDGRRFQRAMSDGPHLVWLGTVEPE